MTLPQLALDVPSLADVPQALPVHGAWILGSDPKRADLCIPDPDVDGVHCVLDLAKDGSVTVRDLGSLQGTRLNGKTIQQAVFRPGDHLDLGAIRLWLVDLAAPKPDSSQLPKVAGFQVLRQLGRGAGGTVYLAVQESLQRQVALKILAGDLSHDPKVVAQFEREARAAAALGHANVVTVYDVGRDGGTHYLSMEYMAGGSLADQLPAHGKGLPWKQVWAVLRDTANALQFAESQGLVHRDIKPANLMVTEAGTTKLADLGLVLDVREASSGGPIVGTPHFLAPELIRGEAPSPRSDLYSLGASVYQLLTGRTPYQGENTKQILREVLAAEPPPLQSLQPELPPGLATLVHDLMAKDPTQRPSSATLLLARLSSLEAELGPSQLPPKKARGLHPAGLLALLVFSGGGYWAYGRWFGPPPGDPLREPSGTTSLPSQASPLDADRTATALEFANTTEDPGADTTTVATLEGEFEARASTALLALSDQVLSEAERVAKLRELAGSYQGSSAADQALSQAAALEEASRQAQRILQEREQLLGTEEARLAAETPWQPESGELASVLTAVLQFAPLVEGEAAVAFESKRAERLMALMQQGERYLIDQLAAVDSRLETGEFGAGKQALLNLRGRFAALRSLDLPETLQTTGTKQALFELLARCAEIDVQLDRLPNRWVAWSQSVEFADQQQFGERLGRHSGFRAELVALDLQAARTRLKTTLDRLQTEAARGWITDLLRDIEAIALVQAAWIQAFGEGTWRRTTTLDPRSERPLMVTVTGVGVDFLSIAGERVAWGTFLAQPLVLHALCDDRLQRPYTMEEAEGLASLYRLQAVLGFLDQVQEMLVSSGEFRFTEGEKRAALDWLGSALPHQASLGAVRLQRELRAAEPLAQGLRCLSEGLPGSAAGYLERTFALGHGTWILALLSDGSELHFPVPDPLPGIVAANPAPQAATVPDPPSKE